ncbi:unnamed protein product [Macrosiphum euphorbiae]|uniref:Uncharacterized protein n=1 Tax=Macrosiphum euphorbiae TaxID=13131 RepID=A0AAV0W7I7_9HEMI|nr:unnamed protein product [Macrosiphum euphorbiae]
MGDDSTAGLFETLSTVQLKPQPINDISYNVHKELITSPKSPKSNYTKSGDISQSNNVSNIDSNTENEKKIFKTFC